MAKLILKRRKKKNLHESAMAGSKREELKIREQKSSVANKSFISALLYCARKQRVNWVSVAGEVAMSKGGIYNGI